MKPLPFPVRLAAGLAATTVERAREVPKQLVGLPVTMVSQVLQASMRVQQNITELAVKGDDVLSVLRPVEETPSWATFDEDLPESGSDDHFGDGRSTAVGLNHVSHDGAPRESTSTVLDSDPWSQEQRALSHDYADGSFDSPAEDRNGETSEPDTGAETGSTTRSGDSSGSPAGMSDYDELSLPQLRAHLRRFDIAELEELLAYEQANANRTSFTRMLARRIDTLRDSGRQSPGQDA